MGHSDKCSSLRIVGVKVFIAEAKETFFHLWEGAKERSKRQAGKIFPNLHFDQKKITKPPVLKGFKAEFNLLNI